MIDNLIEFEKTEEYIRLMSYYKSAIMEVETKFRVLNENFNLQYDRQPICSIKTRLKSDESISNKLLKKGLDLSIENIEDNIFDIAGIRIICSFVDDVYMLADAITKQDDVNIIEIKDYIKTPKQNGYRSLHMIVEIPIFLSTEKKIVKCEIQFRTLAMDAWASLEHQLVYKKDNDFNENNISDIAKCADIMSNFDSVMNILRERMLGNQGERE